MRRSTASELRMLREMVWHFTEGKKCPFCKKELLPGATDLEYGERNCPPIKERLTIHHSNGNHDDNRKKNRKPAHQSCHKRYHIKIQHSKTKGKRIGA